MEETYFYYYDEGVKGLLRTKHELTEKEIGNYIQITEEEYRTKKDSIMSFNRTQIPNEANEIKPRITSLKNHLMETDYQAIKYAEGCFTEEEYAPIKAQRQAWRDEINELEAQLNELVENN